MRWNLGKRKKRQKKITAKIQETKRRKPAVSLAKIMIRKEDKK